MVNVQKTALIILDWFWLNNDTPDENSITQANTPIFDELFKKPYSKLWASGWDVWLPEWQIWNSEVWHLTIGSGRILLQSLPKIEKCFSDNTFKDIDSFKKWIKNVEENNSTLHVFQLLWDGWVHAHWDHLKEILKIIPTNIKVSLHLFLDWRDIAYNSAFEIITELENIISSKENISISSVAWRYFAMDRDNNWERIKEVYDVMTSETEKLTIKPSEYIKSNYDKEVFDEFIPAVSFEAWDIVKENDSVFFLNYRSDRAKQLAQVFVEESFSGFERKLIKNLDFTTMTKYYPEYSASIFVDTEIPKNVLWEVISNEWLNQVHVAETEKFAHVTKFFNWWAHEAFENETWELCPSHKVATYDLDPAMSAWEILDVFFDKAPKNDFTVVNFANWDMVWHTGSMEAAKKAVETLDSVVWKLIEFSKENNIDLLITADHGNCEEMWTSDSPKTSHTTLPVPCWFISNGEAKEILPEGGLQDLAPSVLNNMWIKIPEEMTGKVLMNK